MRKSQFISWGMILCLLSAISARGQSSVYVPNVIPPSPNASSLMKFTDVPVSMYTGTADVTVPIYTIQAKGIEVPISLNYHTGGIRLKEESGIVGLGWALKAGGMISRSIRDKDDFQGSGYLGAFQFPDIAGDPAFPPTYTVTNDGITFRLPNLGYYGYAFFCNYDIFMQSGMVDLSAPFNAPTSYDFEPDLFSFNFLGRGGKFMITRAGKVIEQQQDNLKIQFEANGNSFSITDEQGNQYLFADKEYTAPNSTAPMSVSSWLLSRVVTQVGDTVKFNYSADNTYTYGIGDMFEVYRYGCTASQGLVSSGSYVPVVYLNNTISSIDFRNGRVQFDLDNIRNDLVSGKKLDDIAIYSKNAAGSLQFLKKDSLFYSYFNTGQTYGADADFLRLKLDSVKEMSGTVSIPPYSFTYNGLESNYQMVQRSSKRSFAVDHWGYFNGVGNNTQFTPAYSGYFTYSYPPQTFYTVLSGANREPDTGAVKAFSIKSVTYPTGGQTVFQTELNHYDDVLSSQTGIADFHEQRLVSKTASFYSYNIGTVIDSIDLWNLYGPQITMSVTFRNPANYRNTSGKIYFRLNSYYYDVDGSSLDCSSNSVCTINNIPVTISPGKYPMTFYIDPTVGGDFGGIYVTLTWNELQTVQKTYDNQPNPDLLASGLRIKSITDYSATGAIAKQRVYNYNLGELGTTGSKTYGRLMSYPTYLYNENVLGGGPGGNSACTSISRGSGSNTALTSNIQGNIVGYDQVAEYLVDPVTGSNTGKTVYQYFNSTDTLLNYAGFRLPGTENFGNNLNGTLLSKISYVNNGGIYTKISQTNNFYHLTNRNVYWAIKKEGLNMQGGGTGCPNGGTVAVQYLACLYPAIKSERMLLDSSWGITYDQSNPTKSLLTSTKYNYDNPLHYQQTRETMVNSQGNKLISQYKYPQDYIPNGSTVTGNNILDSLIGHNMVSVEIEKRDSLYYAGSSTGYVTGAVLHPYRKLSSGASPMLPDKIYNLDISGAINDFQPFAVSGNSATQDSRYQQKISYDRYDGTGNVIQYTATDQLPNTFLWDYTKTYPVAKIVNGDSLSVAYTSFEADGLGGIYLDNGYVGITTTDGITGSNSYQINNGLARFNLDPSKTYVVSLWAKSGTPSYNGFNGSTQIVATSNVWTTGKTVNGWTYLEKTMTGVTTINVGGGGGLVDEVRFYPSNAQMTTYTYTPLVGITSQCDVDNRITYYTYDALNRLIWIKDQDGNIIKTIQYHYQAQL